MEYPVMPDIRAKEKVVGGIFTITQTIPLVGAVVSGGALALLTYNATSNIPLTIIVAIIIAVPWLPFAFVTIESMGKMELAKYLFIRLKFKNSQKVWININENKRKRLLKEYQSE